MANTSCRIFKIKCVGDSDNVANMLEDIAEKIRGGMIHTKVGGIDNERVCEPNR